MKGYPPILIPTALLVMLGAGLRHARAEEGVQPTVVTLANGLQLLLVERHEQPTFCGGLIFDVGACNDPAGRSGVAHMFEHMMFKGTQVIGTSDFAAEQAIMEEQDEVRAEMQAEMEKMRVMKRRGEITDVLDAEQWTPRYKALKQRYDALLARQREIMVENELDQIYSSHGGAMLNAGTSEDMTIYFVQLPANKLELFFWLESDRLDNAVMREFYVERDNVREERRLRTESTPTGRFDEAFNAFFWQSHPYGRPVLGWPEEVESITRGDVQDFFHEYYGPDNATLVLVGDFETDRAVELAKKYFERVPPADRRPPLVVTEEPRPIAERRFYAEAETNPQVQLRFLTVAIGHPDEAALDVLAGLLSGKSGRLFKRLVSEADVAIGQPRATNSSRKYAGYFELSATAKEGHEPEELEDLILAEIERVATEEIGERELQKVKNQVLAESIQSLRSNLGLMFQLAVYETWYDWKYINESIERMMAVTAADVQRVAQEYLDPKIRTVAIYRTKKGPLDDLDPELREILAQLSPKAVPQILTGIRDIEAMEDVQVLRNRLQEMNQFLAAGVVKAERRPLVAYIAKTIERRIAALEAEAQEGN